MIKYKIKMKKFLTENSDKYYEKLFEFYFLLFSISFSIWYGHESENISNFIQFKTDLDV